MKKRILLVEDNQYLRMIYRRKLESEDYDVKLARNGEECVHVLKEDKGIDLIVLDIIMPKMDGYAVLEYLQKDSELARIPVVIQSAKGSPHDIDRAMSMGATDYIVKGEGSPADFMKKIHDVLDNQNHVPSPSQPEAKPTIAIPEDAGGFELTKAVENALAEICSIDSVLGHASQLPPPDLLAFAGRLAAKFIKDNPQFFTVDEATMMDAWNSVKQKTITLLFRNIEGRENQESTQ